MKHKMPKKPTREQKAIIKNAGYVPENWLIVGKDNISMTIMNKQSGKKESNPVLRKRQKITGSGNYRPSL